MSRPSYVFDTNTLISALLFERSKPGRAFQKALHDGDILLSLETLEELSSVLGREKFRRYLTLGETDAFLNALVKRALILEPAEAI